MTVTEPTTDMYRPLHNFSPKNADKESLCVYDLLKTLGSTFEEVSNISYIGYVFSLLSLY